MHLERDFNVGDHTVGGVHFRELVMPTARMFVFAVACLLARATSARADVIPFPSAEHTTLQEAIDAAQDGDTVLVAAGEYTIFETLDFNRLHDPGDPASPPVRNLVLRSESGPGETVLTNARSLYTQLVAFRGTESRESRIEGFTLRGRGAPTIRGIYCADQAAPSITDCVIRNYNYGIACNGESRPEILRCHLEDNRGPSDVGVGLRCSGAASPRLQECTISGSIDGVLCFDSSAPSLTGCHLLDNESGIFAVDASTPRLLECTITGPRKAPGSSRWVNAGVLATRRASPVLEGCRIERNIYALHAGDDATPSMVNCVVKDNHRGGISTEVSASVSLRQCTLSGNGDSALLCTHGSEVALESCIVWDNAGGSVELEDEGRIIATCSSLEGSTRWPGVGNIRDDPLFCGWGDVSAMDVPGSPVGSSDSTSAGQETSPVSLGEALEFHLDLAAGSPCIGTGKDGVDMGAEAGRCDGVGVPDRTLRLSEGTYTLERRTLANHASIVGPPEDEGRAVILDQVLGLRTGARLERVTVRDTSEGLGRGVVVGRGEAPQVTECTITGWKERGLFCGPRSRPRIERCVISDCERGGVRCVEASPVFTDCTITRNRLFGSGAAGVDCTDSRVTFERCIISENVAQETSDGVSGPGGLASRGGQAKLVECAVTGNVADRAGGLAAEDLTLLRCTVHANAGGGVIASGVSSLTNCAFWANAPGEKGCGGGLEILGSATLSHCTFTANETADPCSGAGIRFAGYELHMLNCISWGNHGASLLVVRDDATVEVGYSCIEGDEPWPGPENTNVDPQFESPGSYDLERYEGGLPAFEVQPADLHLRETSPIIDSGRLRLAPINDLEGFGRPCGRGVDPGAYETGWCTTPTLYRFLRGDCDGDGKVNGIVTDAVFLLNYNFRCGKEPPCLAACDANADGVTCGVVTDAVYILMWNFRGGPPPLEPFPECDSAPYATDAVLGCRSPHLQCD